MVSTAIINTFDKLIRLSFYAMIFLLPIGIAFVSVFAGMAIMLFFVKRIYQRKMVFPENNFLNLPILFYVIAGALSMVFSQYHQLSIMGFFGKLLRGVFLYVSFLEAFRELKEIHCFVFVWLASSLIIGLSGLCQYVFGFDFIRHLPLDAGRVTVTLRQANDFGAYVISIAPLALCLLLYWKTLANEVVKLCSKVKAKPMAFAVFLFATCFVLIVCLGLSFSRAAWVGFFVSVIFLGCFKQKLLPLIFLVIVAFVWVFTPVMVKTRDVSLITDNVRQPKTYPVGVKPQDNKTIFEYIKNKMGSGRWAYWEEASHIIQDYPLWGVGINSYSQIGSKYKVTWGGYPHNSYLQMTAELGVLGLGSFLWMIGVLFYGIIKRIKQTPAGYARCILIGVLASLCAYLIQSFFDTTFYSVQLSVLMWVMMGLLVATSRMKELTKA